MSSFIIVGIARSGTTLLERLLDNHSKIAVCPESSIFSTLFKLGAIPEITSQYQYEAFYKTVEMRLMNYNDVALEVLRNFKLQHPNFRGSATLLLQKLSSHYAIKKSKTIVGEKTPSHVYYLDLIHQICPQLQYIYITRQPLDICCSLLKLRASTKQYFSNEEVLQAAFLVKKGLWGMRRAPISKQKIQVRYEDLVTKPLASLQSLCEFLDVNFEETMIDFDSSNYVNFSNPNLKRIHQPLSRQVNSNSVGQFEKILTVRQISILNSYFKKDYPQLPYSVTTSPAKLSWKEKILLCRHLIYFHLRSLFWTRIFRRFYLLVASSYFRLFRSVSFFQI